MISLEDIQRLENNRKKIKKETYKKIYEQFNKKIKHAVNLGQKQIFLQIPKWIAGYPSYDLQKAGNYIQRQFENGNFIVSRISTVDIYVSWDKHNKRKHQREPEQYTQQDDSSLASLINLKKMAAKYK